MGIEKKAIDLHKMEPLDLHEMEAQTLDKPVSKIEALLAAGIPCKEALFHKTVMSFVGNGTPEYSLYAPGGSSNKTRIANLWYTPHGLLFEQMGKYRMVPLANVVYATFII